MTRRLWTAAEDEILRERMGWYDPRQMRAFLPGRTRDGINHRAKKLGIPRQRKTLSQAEVATLFGTDGRTVGVWMSRGWLAGKKARRPGFSTSIDGSAMLDFIRNCSAHYDWRRMDPESPLREIAARVARTDPWLTVTQASRRLHIHETRVRDHLASGALPGTRTTGSRGACHEWRVRTSALLAFQQQRAMGGRSQAASLGKVA